MGRAVGNEFTFGVAPDDLGDEFGVQLAKTTQNDFDNGNVTAGDWVQSARASVPFYLAPQSAVYSIRTTGDAPDVVTIEVQLPTPRGNPDLLDMYGWDGQNWEFIPASVVGDKMRATVTRDSATSHPLQDCPASSDYAGVI